ncbi:YitT family protein [Alginatibacterium sediminis]|uniref:YitT family protein n=2 Tax=Alginatibacterium sediminis TaxID=2164068 RepID=A0A420E998_9ALTE|nr:YitT family protein [Alginatibacterium sediminis]
MVALGLHFFKETGLITGGTAGLALLLAKLTSFSFGQLFFAINLPFFVLAQIRMGSNFTLRTFICVSLVSLSTDYMGRVLAFEFIDPIFSAGMGGFLIGTGMLILIRHHSSLGGVNILALYLQDRFNLRAGNVQMALDLLILTASFFIVSWEILLLSIFGAITLNVVIAFNHKKGRYNAVA